MINVTPEDDRGGRRRYSLSGAQVCDHPRVDGKEYVPETAPAKALVDEVVGRPGVADARVLDVRVGLYWTAVLTTIGAGLAATPRDEAHLRGDIPVAGAGGLSELRPVELAGLLTSHSPPEAAVGLAAVNALLGEPEGRVTEDNAETLLRDRAGGRRVALVGHFPLAERLRPHCGELWVFERGVGLGPGDLGPDEMEELLPRAEVVGVTATTLLNGTFEAVCALISPEAWCLMLGPSTPMARCLFECGFEALCGTVVVDPPRVLSAVSEGAVTRQVAGVRRITSWR